MRYYLGLAPSGEFAIQRGVRIDDTGEPLVLVDQFEVARVRINLSDWLETGETVSSATATNNNCAVSLSTSSPNVDMTISNVASFAYGTSLVTITSSSGDIIAKTIRIRRRNRYTDEQTYRDYR